MSLFADLKLPALVTRALTERAYLEAMPVQAAVLDPACEGRDLLVSSQTGSGKTIAFGAVIGQSLLGEGEAKFARKPRPSALVIVPTRELAIQVREELGWLLKHTGMHLASFTGGTSVSNDLQALRRGVDVAIGTPGRLVDLVRRERLDLTDIAVLVLDEADEMLDLGFREDLETLLKASPASRRTLMLSATLPREIRDMARQFQRDALPVDPRTAGGTGVSPQKQAHDDITYVAHLIAAGDRLPAVVNLLRASNAERAIVFCTTREAVGVLHTALIKRGISASAISGDRAQPERDRALDLVRRGEARVLVATNVAARGLHLPDVDLIIHADLPLNAESLTHRSGRTGRAGRKGTAVLLATATERRKAERLLGIANVRATWTPPPSADAITRAACDRLIEDLAADGDALATAKVERVDEVLARLSEKVPDKTLLQRLMLRELDRLPAGETLRQPPSASFSRDGAASREDMDRRPPIGGKGRDGVMFRVNLGVRDKAEARWLLPLICRRGGVTNREVGTIRVGPSETVFEIAPSAAAAFALAAAEPDPRAPHIRVERAQVGGRASLGAAPAPRAPGAGYGRPSSSKPSHAATHEPKATPAKVAAARPLAASDVEPKEAAPKASAEKALGEKATVENSALVKAPHEKPAPTKATHAKPTPAAAEPALPAVMKAPHPKAPRDDDASEARPKTPRMKTPPSDDEKAIEEAPARTPRAKDQLPTGAHLGESRMKTPRPKTQLPTGAHLSETRPRTPYAAAGNTPYAKSFRPGGNDKPFAGPPARGVGGDKPFARAPRRIDGGDAPFARAPRRTDGGDAPFARPARPAGGDAPFARPARPAGGDAPFARAPRRTDGGDAPFARPARPAGGDAPFTRAPRRTDGGNAPFARAPRRTDGGDAPFARPARPASGGAPFARPERPIARNAPFAKAPFGKGPSHGKASGAHPAARSSKPAPKPASKPAPTFGGSRHGSK